MKPVLSVTDLTVSWPGGTRVLEGVSFNLYPGDLVGVIGPSGCGKSTLCLALAGIIPRQLPGRVEGSIYLAGRSLAAMTMAEITSTLGIVFQDPETQLFLPRVRNELAFGPENQCLAREEIWARINTVAAETGVAELLPANPNQLSGGQQQVVALAAVLTLRPRVLILDEVTSQLDPDSCGRIQAIIARLRQQGVAILLVEHNLEQLGQADRVLALTGGRVETAAASELAQDSQWLSRIYGGDSQ